MSAGLMYIDLKAILVKIAAAKAEDIAQMEAEIFPAMVDLTEAEVEQALQQLSAVTKISTKSLRCDWNTHLKANGFAQKPEGGSAATVIIGYALGDGVDLWKDDEQNPWMTFRAGEHWENHPLKSRAATRYLAGLYYHKAGRAPPAQALQDAMQTLEAKAIFDGKERITFIRVAGAADCIYLDLANNLWQVVKISPSGWEVIPAKDAPVKFRRTKSMIALPRPQQGGSMEGLRPVLNLSNDKDWILARGYLLGCLQPTGPYPVLALSGEHDSGKSTVAHLLRDVIDPNTCPLRSLPKGERDLLVSATNGWCLAFDNLSGLPVWISDALCRLSTGGGLSTRELFTDGEEFLLEATRPVILNGIDDIVYRPDLADRTMLLHLPSISDEARRTEAEIRALFAGVHAIALGALLTACAHGLKALPDTKLVKLPRLADFALWVTACEPAFGCQPGTFMAAYTDAKTDMVHDLVETNLVGRAILAFVEFKHKWIGSASELLTALRERNGHVDKSPKDWPTSPEGMVGALKRLAPALRAQGIHVENLPREPGKKRTRRWLLRASNGAAQPSEPSATVPDADTVDWASLKPPYGRCTKCEMPLVPEEKAFGYCVDCKFFAEEEQLGGDTLPCPQPPLQ